MAIDEKILVERLEGLKDEIGGLPTIIWNNAVRVCIREVNQLAEESNNGWIACDKELPKEYTDVLGCDYEGNIMVVRLFTDTVFGKVWGLWNGGNWRFNCIIAWMPLPEPFKPKGE